MKKLLLLTAVALVSTSANAMDIKPYVEGKISENFMKAKYEDPDFNKKFEDSVIGGSIEVGVKLDQFRIGLEGYYNDKMEDKINYLGFGFPVELESKGVFLNGYYDFKLPDVEKVKPYVGLGVGYSWMKETLKLSNYGLPNESIKDKDWGYQIGLGVGYELNQNIDLTLGYRYENLGKIKDYDSENKLTNHKVSLGLRYTF